MYSYTAERSFVLTDEGQRSFLRVRDFAAKCLKNSGAVTTGVLMGVASAGDSFKSMACVDRLLELGEVSEVSSPNYAWQDRIFINRTLI